MISLIHKENHDSISYLNELYKELDIKDTIKLQVIDTENEFGIRISIPSIVVKDAIIETELIQSKDTKYRVRDLVDNINSNVVVFIEKMQYELEKVVAIYRSANDIDKNIIINHSYFKYN